MTWCPGGSHDFPIEDEEGGYCAHHGISMIRHPPLDPEQPPHPLLPPFNEAKDQACST